MGWSAPPAAPKCPCCKVSVYPAEAVMASDRKPYHKKCVKCKSCSKALTPATLNEHQTQLYCLPCYELVYNTNAYSLGSYGGIVTPEDIARREAEERARLEKAERAKRERRCPTCEMKSYPEDSVTVGDLHYHKACLKCTECGRGPDNDTPMMLGPKDQDNVFGDADLEPYCKFCFAKRYKVSALNIAETVTTLVDQGSMSL